MIDLSKILKDAPHGLPLYSLIHGEVYFDYIKSTDDYKIVVKDNLGNEFTFNRYGSCEDLNEEVCYLVPTKGMVSWDWDNPMKYLLRPGHIVALIDPEDGACMNKYLIIEYQLGYNQCVLLSYTGEKIYFSTLDNNSLRNTKNLDWINSQYHKSDVLDPLEKLGYVWDDNRLKVIPTSSATDKKSEYTFELDKFKYYQYKPGELVLYAIQQTSGHRIWLPQFFGRKVNDDKVNLIGMGIIEFDSRYIIPYTDTTKNLAYTSFIDPEVKA